ncbi:MAG: hypothetical protein KGZ40_06910 [Clostridiales bacterium]|nr:hypothetical protein [Clostridiales bacterium]
MRLDASDIDPHDSKPVHIRLDLISRTGGSGLWWVAQQFEDGTRKPEGMFTEFDAARALATELAASLGIPIIEKDFAS